MKVGYIPQLRQIHTNDTSYRYSQVESKIAGVIEGSESVIGTLMNFLIFFALLRNRNLRIRYFTPWLMSITMVLLLLSSIYLSIGSLRFFKRDMPLPTWTSCRVYAFIAYGLWHCFVWNLAILAVLRCIVCEFPKLLETRKFLYVCRITPLIGWMLSSVVLIPTVMGKYGQFGLECKSFNCIIININIDGMPTVSNPIYLYVASIATACILATIINIKTYVSIWRDFKKSATSVREPSENGINPLHNELIALGEKQKVFIVLELISVSFFLTFAPEIILYTIDPDNNIFNPTIYLIGHLLRGLIVIVVPVLILICYNGLLNEIKDIFKSIYLHYLHP